MKLIFNYKSLLLAGLSLNIALMIYIYFLVDGGSAAMRQGGGWMAILNEIPMTVLFFLAGVFKPYFMVWSKCRKHPELIWRAAAVMFATTAMACLISFVAKTGMVKDMALYINWAFLWAASAYYVLINQQIARMR